MSKKEFQKTGEGAVGTTPTGDGFELTPPPVESEPEIKPDHLEEMPVVAVPCKRMEPGEFRDFLRGDMSQEVEPVDLLYNLRFNRQGVGDDAALVNAYFLSRILAELKKLNGFLSDSGQAGMTNKG